MVTVKLFGALRLSTGIKSLELDAGCVRELYPLIISAIMRDAPNSGVTEKDVKSCMVAVNENKGNGRTVLHDGDVVYIIPPAAGG